VDKLNFQSSLLANRKVTKLPTNSLIATRSPEDVDRCLKANSDVTDIQWLNRHAKLIYLIGMSEYCDLADTARKGKNPKALMGWLVNKNLNGRS